MTVTMNAGKCGGVCQANECMNVTMNVGKSDGVRQVNGA